MATRVEEQDERCHRDIEAPGFPKITTDSFLCWVRQVDFQALAQGGFCTCS
jgi:hypothetical protein